MQKFLGLALATIAVLVVFGGQEASAASASPSACNTTFYANGTPIKISAGDAGGTKISWTENGTGECIYTAEQAKGLSIYGGYRNNYNGDMAERTSTSIEMTGGVVAYLNGGGLGRSYVTTATLNVTGGTILYMLSAGGTDGGVTASLADAMAVPTLSKNIVETATLNVGAGVTTTVSGAFPIIFSGSDNGYGYVGTATIDVAGGDWKSLTASGSNGYVNKSIVSVTGGTFDNIHGNNHGSLGTFEFAMTGGEVNGLYAGADCDAVTCPDVKGALGTAVLKVTGGKVKMVSIGYDKDGALNRDASTQSTVALTYLENTILDVTGVDDFATANTAELVEVLIDNFSFIVEVGKTLGEYTFDGIRNRDGFSFGGFKDAAGNILLDSAVINGAMTLSTTWTELPENPNTLDNVVWFAIIGTVCAVVACIAIPINRKAVIEQRDILADEDDLDEDL